ncbi:MAG TPA: TMEM165/GDT1 family protein [Actinomycetales bacterium]|nr:TMEM165/GDT1 family protein [Actinomycetales bacterium]
MDPAVALTALLLIVPVELPDKTFVATLVLATRYRPLAVWVGVGLAFLVQTLVAVTAGGLIAQLPRRPVEVVAATLFAIGGFVLLRGASRADEEEAETEEEFAGKVAGNATTGLRAVGASFLVLFVAEWGDLSQLLTAGLVVRTKDPVSVFVGAWVGLLLVSALGAAVGRVLLTKVRLSTIRRIGGGVCLLLAVLTALQALGLEIPV